MGFSERTGQMHRLADRIDELDALTAALDVEGPVLVVAHDWGGPISLGWAAAPPRSRQRHRAAQHGGEPAGRVRRPPADRRRARRAGCCVPSRNAPARSSTARCGSPTRRCPRRSPPPTARPTVRRPDARPSRTSSPTSRSRTDHPSRPDPRRRRRRARVRCGTCRRCCSGDRATRCSPTATCATCNGGCPTRRPTASRVPDTSSSRTHRSPTRCGGSPTTSRPGARATSASTHHCCRRPPPNAAPCGLPSRHAAADTGVAVVEMGRRGPVTHDHLAPAARHGA